MTNGEDDRYRSRKWRLAIASLALGTIGATILEIGIFLLLWKNLIPDEIWLKATTSVLYWWLFVDLTVLAGYGFANVVEKWSPGVAK